MVEALSLIKLQTEFENATITMSNVLLESYWRDMISE